MTDEEAGPFGTIDIEIEEPFDDVIPAACERTAESMIGGPIILSFVLCAFQVEGGVRVSKSIAAVHPEEFRNLPRVLRNVANEIEAGAFSTKAHVAGTNSKGGDG